MSGQRTLILNKMEGFNASPEAINEALGKDLNSMAESAEKTPMPC